MVSVIKNGAYKITNCFLELHFRMGHCERLRGHCWTFMLYRRDEPIFLATNATSSILWYDFRTFMNVFMLQKKTRQISTSTN